MKKYAGKAVKAAKIAALSAAFVYFLGDTRAAAEAVGESLQRCIEIVIPSLFAMMIVSSMMTASGMMTLIPRWLGRFSRLLFGMEEGVFPIFTFGMIAGYPVGMKMLCEEFSCGRLDRKRAELLSGLCFGAGPAFIFGCISRQLYSSPDAGLVILLSTVSANIILALLLSVPLRRTARARSAPRRVSISADMLTDCVLRSGRAMGDICIMTAAFAAANAALARTGMTAAAGELLAKLPDLDRIRGEVIVAAFLDITNISRLPCGDWLLLPYISALTAFGGVCVIFQLRTLTAGKLALKPFIIMRGTAAVLSFTICRLIMPFFMTGEVTEAMSPLVSSTGNNSPVPSVMLVIMTVMLMVEFGGKDSLQHTKSS
ncbi:hypothetical protein [Ruminococcus sp.]|uniref:hypothetical protein n=1 Tax=Ruminococcus sp. TaxID=41978 RepID=UPI0025FD5407|nr:hypothetical protein [Ruminococcus sp.]MCR4638210.1 hypothetical protein [Ruminococcus sp.]